MWPSVCMRTMGGGGGGGGGEELAYTCKKVKCQARVRQEREQLA